jgi:hypothetical protein
MPPRSFGNSTCNWINAVHGRQSQVSARHLWIHPIDGEDTAHSICPTQPGTVRGKRYAGCERDSATGGPLIYSGYRSGPGFFR